MKVTEALIHATGNGKQSHLRTQFDKLTKLALSMLLILDI